MATDSTSRVLDEPPGSVSGESASVTSSAVRQILKPLASLRLTVVLFAMAIFLTLAGTFAQVDQDIWQVIDGYFRTWVAWIDLQLFFPPSFFPSQPVVPGGFYFPGGWIIGSLMIANLLAAHSLRFKPQAKGTRLLAGFALIVVGVLVTWLVIVSGSSADGFQGESLIASSTLWGMLKAALGVLWVATVVGLVRVESHRTIERWGLTFAVVGVGVLLMWLLFRGDTARLDDSGMRIMWQLLKGMLAGGVLLVGCMMVFKKRAGIVLLHGGVGLMMLNELLVGLLAVEAQMPIEEGKTVSFVQDIRTVELAVVDSSDPEVEDVVAIPKSLLTGSELITDDNLPFDIRVLQFMQNSRLTEAGPTYDPPEVWQRMAAGGMRKAAFAIAGDGQTAEVTIVALPGTAGGLLANVNRWRDQIGLEPFSEEELASGSQQLDVGGQPGRYVQLDGSEASAVAQSILGVILQRRERSWYFKLMGGSELVHSEQPRFEQFIGSVKFAAADNLADTGNGVAWVAEEVRPGAGTDTGGEVDITSAYVELLDKQTAEPLGSYLLNVLFSEEGQPERVTVGETTYEVSLRFERTYKPYTIRLIDVRKDDYIGTATPRNYSSDVRLVDEERGVDREVHIWMNNPLRFAGETFYQHGYQPAMQGRNESTTLQVVTNAGWMIPYVACMIVAVGMLYQFSITLSRFLNRRASEAKSGRIEIQPPSQKWRQSPPSAAAPPRGRFGSWVDVLVPLLIVAVLGGWLLSKARVPKPEDGKANLVEFGKLPVVFEGRVKPLDTLARNSLLVISDKQTFVDTDGEDQPAIRWFLDIVARPDVGLTHRVFRIENLNVLDTLGLEPRIVRDKRLSFRYGMDEFQDKIQELARQADMARKVNPVDMSVFQKKVLELEQKIGTLYLLMESFNPPRIRPDHVREDLQEAMRRLAALSRRSPGPPLVVPPQSSEEEWETYATAWTKGVVRSIVSQPESRPATESLTKMLLAYADDDAEAFNSEVESYRVWLSKNAPDQRDLEKADFESFFNNFSPFYYSSFAYMFAFVITALGWLGWTRGFNRSAFGLIVLTLVVHTFALGARIYISGRPPVTNLYSSAVFIGWGGVVLGLVLELVYRLGVGNIIAAVAGSITLGIAHFLAADGDTFVVLQAVLDTQFWLSTHVVIVTLGYMTTFVAGFLGVLYVLRGVFTPSLSPRVGKDLTRMIYGTLCFSLWFSFVGTVLGGLWADDSWGRFWGWDPKENGALIIVLWNALVLHARWGKLVGDRGLALLCVAGNIAVGWSWFGVNELGIGLHSYGFTEGVLRSLGLFAVSQIAIIAAGLLPTHMWWSTRRNQLADSETQQA